MLFREAGLDPAKWTAAEPVWTLSHYADRRAGWQGELPERPEVPVRVEAAAYRSRQVYWILIGPRDRASLMAPPPSSRGEKAANGLFIVLLVALIGGGAFLARRNLRMGRGDRRGAGRLACCVFALTAPAWIFAEHHVPALGEIYLFILFAGWALFVSGLLWLLYIALEPFVRRRWPVSLISWSRLLSGRFRDPLVGRDLLVGCVFGVVWTLLNPLNHHLASWIGSPPGPPFAGALEVFAGVRAIIPVFSFTAVVSTFLGLASLFILFLLRVLLRRQWAAAAAFVLIVSLAYTLGSDAPLLNGFFKAFGWGICLLALVRFGLLTLIAGDMLKVLLVFLPISTELSAWYSGIGLTGLALLLGLTVYAFHTSPGGRPRFGRVSIEE